MASSDDFSALENYHSTLRNEVWERLNTSESGGTQEQTFTQYAIDLLAEAGEAENARECYDEKADRIGRRIHKINGYSLSENLETVQLFYTIYKSTESVSKIYKADIEGAVNASTRFLKNALNRYFEEMEVTAAAFDFARELGTHSNDIERAEIFILTDGECDVEKPDDQQIRNVLVMYRIIDLRYLMRLEGGQPDPITIDFEQLCGQSIPCLVVPVSNDDYQSYLAVVSGDLLAEVYKRYGARLLEMNVRSFLQFTGQVNQGIRKTIREEPHMFLAFNNGIAATAEEVELVDLPSGGKAIKSVRELQIVNGGQTTASILHTRQKDKAPVDKVFVQMKLSVIKNRTEISSIVNRISEYANSQNKVSRADLTANSPFHIEIEKLSRLIWSPPQPGVSHQTRWFYERARGQYKNELDRQLGAKQKNAFLAQTPKSQLLVKEELAKYLNVWAKLPHYVVQGNQKNYRVFIESLKTKKDQQPNSIFFEDLIAKAILFRSTEKIYGVKPNALGDLRYVTVPYTLAYLNQVTNNELNLLKIWKQQNISDTLKTVLATLMVQIEAYIKKNAPGSLYGEWAKREVCWQAVSRQKFIVDYTTIKADLIDPANPPLRKLMTNDDAEKILNQNRANWLCSVPAIVWDQIAEWGRIFNLLTFNQRQVATEIASLVRKWSDKAPERLTAAMVSSGETILEKVIAEVPQLLESIPDDVVMPAVDLSVKPAIEVTVDIVRQAVAFDKRKKVLKIHAYNFLKEIVEGRKTLNEHNKGAVRKLIGALVSKGFEVTPTH